MCQPRPPRPDLIATDGPTPKLDDTREDEALPDGWVISVNTSDELELSSESAGSPYVNIQPGRRGCEFSVHVRSEGAPLRVIAHAMRVWTSRVRFRETVAGPP